MEVEKVADQKRVKGHAYSITAAEQVHYSGSLVELLRIRNPWGFREWTGAWSDESKEWDQVLPDEKKKLNYSAEDGEFWMSYNDFLLQYSGLETCNLTPDTLSSDQVGRRNYAEFEGEWKVGSTAGGCRNYPNPSTFLFFCGQYKGRSNGHPGLDVLSEKKLAVARSKASLKQREVCQRVLQLPGEFIIIPSNYHEGMLHHEGAD
ncbi:hypothetical protein Q5P01_025835 [Channa striata]|uniref:Calpain catalytic domain-containing protein n=1 Tax=Channa striata TaxID=64152 RepID=A0AA88J2I9_CHASR|nr:hypothetical protein Q5P01_025835 [Channa striata]